jgi:hypothetical protein
MSVGACSLSAEVRKSNSIREISFDISKRCDIYIQQEEQMEEFAKTSAPSITTLKGS